MTGTTRRDITTTRLRAPGVTSITSRVRIKARRNGKRDASLGRPMTGRATDAAHVQVARVIELHVEAPQTRERFERA